MVFIGSEDLRCDRFLLRVGFDHCFDDGSVDIKASVVAGTLLVNLPG